MLCAYHIQRHVESQEIYSLLGSAPQTPTICRPLSWPPHAGTHGHRFGQPLSRSLKARFWGHVQDQPRSTCLVKMIWVKGQHAQDWPWKGDQP